MLRHAVDVDDPQDDTAFLQQKLDRQVSAVTTLIKKRRLFLRRQRGTQAPDTDKLLTKVVAQLGSISKTLLSLYDLKRMKHQLVPDIAMPSTNPHPDPPSATVKAVLKLMGTITKRKA